jgi:hypothetical protein
VRVQAAIGLVVRRVRRPAANEAGFCITETVEPAPAELVEFTGSLLVS